MLNRLTCTTSSTYTDKPDLAADYLTLRYWTWFSLPQPCRWDMDWKTHYITTGPDSDSYTINFMAKTWHWDRFLHILRFLHFADNSQRPDEGKECDQLWKLRTVFDKLNEAYAEFCNPLEHLAVDEVIVKFKGRVIFRQYSPKKRKCFSIKIYKFCNESGYTWHDSVLG